MACERQIYRLRNIFFSQIIRQDITWFDINQSGDLTTKLFEYVTNFSSLFLNSYLFIFIVSSDLERIREGISSKFSILTQYISTFISGLLIGFYISPQLTGILLLVGPIIIGITAYLSLVIDY